MNDTERKELTELVYQALSWAHVHGNIHGTPAVIISAGGAYDVEYGQHDWRDTLLDVSSLADVLGQDWDTGIDTEDDDAVERALRNGADWWVEDCVADAIENLERAADEIDTGGAQYETS